MRNAQHAATIMSAEERLLAKNAARENYGSIAPKSHEDGERRSRGSATLIEERVTISASGENGKVVITPVSQASDDEDEGRPLL